MACLLQLPEPGQDNKNPDQIGAKDFMKPGTKLMATALLFAGKCCKQSSIWQLVGGIIKIHFLTGFNFRKCKNILYTA